MNIIISKTVVLGITLSLVNVVFALDRTPSKENAKVYIIAPSNDAVVATTFKVQFGLSGMGIAPAGITKSGTGHHHLIIDGDITKIPKNVPIGTQAKHFGGGQTEVTLTLPKGKHTLQLLLADKFHIPHQPVINSEKINITVMSNDY